MHLGWGWGDARHGRHHSRSPPLAAPLAGHIYICLYACMHARATLWLQPGGVAPHVLVDCSTMPTSQARDLAEQVRCHFTHHAAPRRATPADRLCTAQGTSSGSTCCG